MKKLFLVLSKECFRGKLYYVLALPQGGKALLGFRGDKLAAVDTVKADDEYIEDLLLGLFL